MKKLMLIALIGATVGSTLGVASKPWSDPEGTFAYKGSTFNPAPAGVAGAVGALYRAFMYDKTTGKILSQMNNPVDNRLFLSAVRVAVESNDFTDLDEFGKKYSNLKVHGATLPQWITLAKEGHVPAGYEPPKDSFK